jgi:hypothetical protein
VAYLEGSGRLESKWRNIVATAVANVNVQHIAPALVEYLDNRESMFLQSGVGELLHSFVGAVASVVHCASNVLYVFVDLLLLRGGRLRAGADKVDKWLDALHEGCSLILEVILLELDMLNGVSRMLPYLESGHATISLTVDPV